MNQFRGYIFIFACVLKSADIQCAEFKQKHEVINSVQICTSVYPQSLDFQHIYKEMSSLQNNSNFKPTSIKQINFQLP